MHYIYLQFCGVIDFLTPNRRARTREVIFVNTGSVSFVTSLYILIMLKIWILIHNLFLRLLVKSSGFFFNSVYTDILVLLLHVESKDWRHKVYKFRLIKTVTVTVCVFVCHLFSFYPFYFDFHSARIIFDVSSSFYLWNINKTTAWHL